MKIKRIHRDESWKHNDHFLYDVEIIIGDESSFWNHYTRRQWKDHFDWYNNGRLTFSSIFHDMSIHIEKSEKEYNEALNEYLDRL